MKLTLTTNEGEVLEQWENVEDELLIQFPDGEFEVGACANLFVLEVGNKARDVANAKKVVVKSKTTVDEFDEPYQVLREV